MLQTGQDKISNISTLFESHYQINNIIIKLYLGHNIATRAKIMTCHRLQTKENVIMLTR